MSLKKIYTLLFIIPLLIVACGSDEKSSSLRHISSSLPEDEFKMYAVTEDGIASELTKDQMTELKIKVSNIFADSLFEGYSTTVISFVDDKILIDPQQRGTLPEINDYEFIDGSLYLLNGDRSIYMGEGSNNQITIRRHFVAYKRLGNLRYHYIRVNPRKDIDEHIAAGLTPIQSIDLMVNEGDTLAWCTRNSLFQ